MILAALITAIIILVYADIRYELDKIEQSKKLNRQIKYRK